MHNLLLAFIYTAQISLLLYLLSYGLINCIFREKNIYNQNDKIYVRKVGIKQLLLAIVSMMATVVFFEYPYIVFAFTLFFSFLINKKLRAYEKSDCSCFFNIKTLDKEERNIFSFIFILHILLYVSCFIGLSYSHHLDVVFWIVGIISAFSMFICGLYGIVFNEQVKICSLNYTL